MTGPEDDLFDRVCALIEREFFDARFLEEEWPECRRVYEARYRPDGSRDHRETVLRDMVQCLGASHCLLVTPEVGREIEAKSADPRRLAPVLERHGDTLLAAVRSMKVRTTTRADVRALAEALQGADRLVLDLRLNDGGSGAKVAEVASLFLPPDTPVLRVRRRDADGATEPHVVRALPEEENLDHGLEVALLREHPFVEYRTPEPETGTFAGPITVLVGPRCYSCGEALAQALKEHAEARLVGARTAGMVLAADEHDLGGGYRLLLPFADMESGKGYRIEGRGVEPHVEADLEDLEGEGLLRRLSAPGPLAGGSAP